MFFVKNIPAILLLSVAIVAQTSAQTPTASPSAKPSPPASPAVFIPVSHPPVILLKLDDYGGDNPNFQRVFDYLAEHKIKSSVGIVCKNLEKAPSDPKRFEKARQMQKSGLFEFWFHGYDHMEWVDADGFQHNEFDGRTVEEMKSRFDLSQELARRRLGFYLRVVGPPGGGPLPKGVTPGKSAPGRGLVSSTAYQAIQDDPHLKIWLYGSPIDAAGKGLEGKGKITILDRDANLENPTFVPNFERFEKEYPHAAATRQYLVLQGHPWAWNDERYANFVKIIEFLVAQNSTFTTPSEYCHLPSLELFPTDGTWTPPADTPAPASKP